LKYNSILAFLVFTDKAMSEKMLNFTRSMSQPVTSRKRKAPQSAGRRRKSRRRRRRISWPRVSLAIIIFAALVLLLTLPWCSSPADKPLAEKTSECVAAQVDTLNRAKLLHKLLTDSCTAADVEPPAAPDAGCVRLPTRFRGSIGRTFNDSNHVHLSAAALSGILPISDNRSAWEHGRGLVELRSCRDFYIDRLKHSYPYLTHTGAALLHEIGRRFNDSLAARGGGAYRIKVTSLLRTDRTVGRLRRVNRNATSRSAHQYGSTFDISYSKFICDDSTATPRRCFEDLKNLLAEVIDGLRDEGRCYVKHERRQACFHITARAASDNKNSETRILK